VAWETHANIKSVHYQHVATGWLYNIKLSVKFKFYRHVSMLIIMQCLLDTFKKLKCQNW